MPQADAGSMPLDALGEVLFEAASAAARAFGEIPRNERRRPGGRRGQYYIDLVADEAMCGVLHRAGLRVLSEESGTTGGQGGGDVDGLLVVADPIDGSTNASLGIPWFATSLCVLDDEGMLLSLVVNHANGVTYRARRGGGATRDGRPISPSSCTSLGGAVIGVSGLPAAGTRWAQFRALGAASLDMCAVAEGVLDAYAVVGTSRLHPWDYLGALLVCKEAGAAAGERGTEELVVSRAVPRRPVVAATSELLAEMATSLR